MLLLHRWEKWGPAVLVSVPRSPSRDAKPGLNPRPADSSPGPSPPDYIFSLCSFLTIFSVMKEYYEMEKRKEKVVIFEWHEWQPKVDSQLYLWEPYWKENQTKYNLPGKCNNLFPYFVFSDSWCNLSWGLSGFGLVPVSLFCRARHARNELEGDIRLWSTSGHSFGEQEKETLESKAAGSLLVTLLVSVDILVWPLHRASLRKPSQYFTLFPQDWGSGFLGKSEYQSIFCVRNSASLCKGVSLFHLQNVLGKDGDQSHLDVASPKHRGYWGLSQSKAVNASRLYIDSSAWENQQYSFPQPTLWIDIRRNEEKLKLF